MPNPVFSAVKDFFYSVTTKDHYASFDSPNNSRRPLTEGDDGAQVANSNGDNPYHHNQSSEGAFVNGSDNTLLPATSNATLPYSPGLRSSQTLLGTGGSAPGTPMASTSTIPLQDYVDGAFPAPPVTVSWKRIDHWLENHYPELFDQLGDGVTAVDLNELEADLDCSLPADVRESYMIHDGQDQSGQPTGLIFGITLMDLENVEEEWSIWKRVAEVFQKQQLQAYRHSQIEERDERIPAELRLYSAAPPSANGKQPPPAPPQQPETPGASSGNPHNVKRNPQNPRRGALQPHRSTRIKQGEFTTKQTSVPNGAIQRTYANVAWIPLAKDFSGNNIAVDVNPGPAGRWGQIILFGREQDRKYVVSQSWAHFLATLADDLESGNWSIDEFSEDLDFSYRGKQISYFDVLKRRVDRALMKNVPRAVNRPSSANGARQSMSNNSVTSPVALSLPGSARSRSASNTSTSTAPRTSTGDRKSSEKQGEESDLLSSNTSYQGEAGVAFSSNGSLSTLDHLNEVNKPLTPVKELQSEGASETGTPSKSRSASLATVQIQKKEDDKEKEEIKDEVKKELEPEIKEEIKHDIKEEEKPEQVKEELEAEIKEQENPKEVKEELEPEIKEEIKHDIKEEEQVKEEVKKELEVEIKDEIKEDIEQGDDDKVEESVSQE